MQAVLPLLLILGILVMLVLPGRRRVQAQRALLSSLAPGDEVMTSGGIIGTVVSLGEREAMLEIAPGIVIRIALPAIIGRPSPNLPTDTVEPNHHEDAE